MVSREHTVVQEIYVSADHHFNASCGGQTMTKHHAASAGIARHQCMVLPEDLVHTATSKRVKTSPIEIPDVYTL